MLRQQRTANRHRPRHVVRALPRGGFSRAGVRELRAQTNGGAVFDAEARRGQVPRVLVEDGRTFYEGLSADAADLSGAGVSPGVAEGVVRVVHDPAAQQLRAGEILVCRGTDPAWTPLFIAAAGLVTEVGGLMTHGSVVAREYGIPAVVGVHDATRRLVQSALVDGPGGKYLIQHSAGSGKTNSIAWTAHFLSDLHDAQNN